MNELQPGDRIDIAFVNAADVSIRATVSRFLSDQQEGLSPEAENYVSCWIEICVDRQKEAVNTQTITFLHRLEILPGWTGSKDPQV